MVFQKILACAVLALTLHQTSASEQCNAFNFGLQGAYTCGLNWWTAEDLGQVIDVTYKISGLIEGVLQNFGIPLDEVNSSLYNNIGANSTDPLTKIIESIATVEPYFAYLVTDLIRGMEMTEADLAKVGLPIGLANKRNLVTMFSDYMDFSCTNHGVRPFVNCLTTWIDQFCTAEDEMSVIINILESLRDAYCDGTSADSTLIHTMTEDVGEVFSSIPKFLGIYKDPYSPYVFNISQDSVIFDYERARRLGEKLQRTCGDSYQTLYRDMAEQWTSTKGVGVLVNEVLERFNEDNKCVTKLIMEEYPEAFENNEILFKHLRIVQRHYGVKMELFDDSNSLKKTIVHKFKSALKSLSIDIGIDLNIEIN